MNPTGKRSFPNRAESVAAARTFVRQTTKDLNQELQDDVSLMVSELCTNAILHGSGPFVVGVVYDSKELRVTVTDRGVGGVTLEEADVMRPRGRGLRIVDQLADEWGTGTTPAGETVVWFRRELAAGHA